MWFNIDRVSNQEPKEDEFRRMFQMFSLTGLHNPEDEEVKEGDKNKMAGTSYQKYLLKEKISIKA